MFHTFETLNSAVELLQHARISCDVLKQNHCENVHPLRTELLTKTTKVNPFSSFSFFAFLSSSLQTLLLWHGVGNL